MMEWLRFLENERIPYVSRGPNTKRGEVSVKCPWCGPLDPSEHLGISLTEEKWGCYRDPSHRGKKPAFLVSALVGITFAQAQQTVWSYSHTDPDELSSALALLEAGPEPEPEIRELVIPEGFVPITNDRTRRKYWDYLERRGFENIGMLSWRYKLYCCHEGRWKDRIIFPMYKGGRLIGWTGRALADSPQQASRYLTSSGAAKQTVLFEDDLWHGGKALFIDEGPFDALKMDCFGLGLIRATCAFGTSASPAQQEILYELSKRYSRTVILFDKGALPQATLLQEQLAGPNNHVEARQLNTLKDPGSMTKEAIERVARIWGK